MPNKRKPVSRAVAPAVWTDGKDPAARRAWEAFERGDREPLIQIWQRHINEPIPPILHQIILGLIEQASISIKRKPGRPYMTSRVHNDAERAELAKAALWLRKLKPRMSVEHARRLVASYAGITYSERLIKQYCLDYNRSRK